MIGGLKDLAAPVSRLQLRFDVGGLTTAHGDGGRAELRLEIATRPDLWYAVGVSTIDATTSMTTSDAGEPVVMTTTASSDSFTLSARVFKRLGPVVLSAGVVDSHAGVGVELRGLDDRLRFEVLASEWMPTDAGAAARVRVGGSAQWRFLYVQAGVLDVVSGLAANAYVGGGLRWTDPDLLGTLWWLRR